MDLEPQKGIISEVSPPNCIMDKGVSASVAKNLVLGEVSHVGQRTLLASKREVFNCKLIKTLLLY